MANTISPDGGKGSLPQQGVEWWHTRGVGLLASGPAASFGLLTFYIWRIL